MQQDSNTQIENKLIDFDNKIKNLHSEILDIVSNINKDIDIIQKNQRNPEAFWDKYYLKNKDKFDRLKKAQKEYSDFLMVSLMYYSTQVGDFDIPQKMGVDNE